jgi:CRISPR-associated protein Csb3
MKTRNQGQEFLVHRLSPLASTVASRSPAEIFAGLTGQVIRDELGKNSPGSRTATGLSTPGPVDSAIAWCALWGLSVAPTIPRKDELSRSPGVWPSHRLHPTWAALPVFTVPVTQRRFAQVLTSAQFDTLGRSLYKSTPPNGVEAVQIAAAATWLKQQGMRAAIVFPILKAGSGNAPERQLLTGEVSVLP